MLISECVQMHLHLLVLQMLNVKFQVASLQVSSVKFGSTSCWHGCPQFTRFSSKSDNLKPFGCSSCKCCLMCGFLFDLYCFGCCRIIYTLEMPKYPNTLLLTYFLSALTI